jgi:hypothetical protein
MSNGSKLLTGVDGRSTVARRFRDIMRGYAEEFEVVTEAEQVLVRQAATLAILSEQLQAQLVKGEPIDADTITKLTGQLRRVLADLKRKAQASAPERPSILDHFASYPADADASRDTHENTEDEDHD